MSADSTSFAEVFAAALKRSAMGLNELARLLNAEGLNVSAATLSYWRKGVRNPGRKASTEVVRAIERILELESGALLAHAVGSRVRGRGLRTAPLGRGDQRVSRRLEKLLDEIGMVGEPRPLSLIVHEHVHLDARARRRLETITQVMRAADGPISSFYLGQTDERADDGPWRVSDMSIGEVSAVAMDRGMRLMVMRVDLPRPLRQGDTFRVDYTLEFPYASGAAHYHERWLTHSLREHVLNVYFDPSYTPAEAESYSGGEDLKPNTMLPGHAVSVTNGFAQTVSLDLPPGVVGMRWRFPEEDGWEGIDRSRSPDDPTAKEGWQAIRSVTDIIG